ncbi:MAG: hypothetical protein GY795_29255 [Desulfobacterales bacterium]|nr:hypothetical protein [Desulfobacterales bacterium]
MEFVLLSAIVSFIFLYALMRKEFIRQKLKEPGTRHERKLTSDLKPKISIRQPDNVTKKEPGNFVQQAATTCLYIPLICFIIETITKQSTKQSHFAGFVIGIIILLLITAGVVMAIIAMATYRKHGDKKILIKGVAGFLINGFLVCVIFMAAAGEFHKIRERREIIKTMQKNVSENVKILERSLQDEDIGEQQLEAFDKGIKNLKAYSATTSHEESKILNVLAKAVEHTRKPIAEYNSAFSEYNKTGGIDAVGINSVDDINKRLELLKKFEQANENLDAVFNVLEDRLRKGLLSEGVVPDKADKYISIWKERSMPDTVRKIRDTDRRVIKEFRSILKTYIIYWGEWYVDSETGEVLCESDPAIAEYNKHIRSIDRISEEQKALQREILSSLKNGLKK